MRVCKYASCKLQGDKASRERGRELDQFAEREREVCDRAAKATVQTIDL